MEACETMGGANNICSDKTGTLTMNQMFLAEFWNTQKVEIKVHQEELTPEYYFSDKTFLELFKVASLLNSSAELEPPKGSSTEIAFLKFFKNLGVNYTHERTNYNIEIKFPFSSARKRMSVILQFNNQLHLFTKGASEMVLHNCTHIFNSTTGNEEVINPAQV